MSDSCFSIYDAYGNPLFNDQASGVYAKAGAGSAPRVGFVNYYSIYNTPVTGNQITAVKPTSYVCTFAQRKASANIDIFVIGTSQAAITLPYITLDTPNNITSPSTYGLQVFNPSSEKIFDSGMQYFVVRDYIELSLAECAAATNPQGPATIIKNHTYCENPYYIISGLQYLTANSIGPFSGNYYIFLYSVGARYISNTQVAFWAITSLFFGDGASKDGVYAHAASTQVSPQYILVGELKNY